MKRINRIVQAVLFAGVGGLLSACSESTVPDSGTLPPSALTPSRLVAQGQTEFTATVGTVVNQGPAVRVLDQDNHPLAGVSVTFRGMVNKVVVSDADGIAALGALKLDTVAADNFIDARIVLGVQREISIGFSIRVMPGPVAHLIALSGNNQIGPPRKTLINHLYAKATDIYNNPISGVPVTFSVVAGGGTVELQSDTTNTFGVSTAGGWTLGSTSAQQASARAAGFEALFDATLCADAYCGRVPLNLAYVRDGAVWVAAVDGPVVVAHDARRPSWSPDGLRLAFFKLNANQEDVAICIASPPFLAVECAQIDVYPREIVSEMRAAWSPDGRTLALSRLYFGPGDSQLLYLDVATMSIGRFGTIDHGVWSASWSPDGKRMAIATDAAVYLADAGGNERQVLVPPVYEVAWAPDGGKIGVITLGCIWECFGLNVALLDPQTRELQVLVRGEGFSALAWSPDGNRVAYSGGSNGLSDVRITTLADHSTEIVLTNASDPSWHP